MIQSVNSVPAFDIKQQYSTLEAEVSAAVLEVLASGRYIGGPLVDGFWSLYWWTFSRRF